MSGDGGQQEAADPLTEAAAPAFRRLAEAARATGIDVSQLSFDELMQLADLARDSEAQRRAFDAEALTRARTLDLEFREQQARVESEAREAKIREDAARREAGVRLQEHRVRAGLAALLVLGAVGGVVWGIARGLPAEELAQYLAPISGLAGIAVGYFFGRQSSSN